MIRVQVTGTLVADSAKSAGRRKRRTRGQPRVVSRPRVPYIRRQIASYDILSEEGAQVFLDQVPHAKYADISNAGHMVAGDRNDLFTDAVLAFLTEIREAG